MSKRIFPEPVVGALIFNKKGELFLMKSYKWKGKYVIPGGHIEFGEKIKEALRREIKEETGLDIYEIKFLNLGESIFSKKFHEKKHFIFINFICKAKSGRVKLNSEGQKFIWIFPKEALKLLLPPNTRMLIEKYINGQRNK